MQSHPFRADGPPTGGTIGKGARVQRTFLRSISYELMGLLIFVAIFHLLSAIGAALDETGLLLVSLVMAVVPALLWLAVFYRMDRAEPEPKQLVLGVYLTGLLLMAALYQPLFGVLFAMEGWLRVYWWSHLLGGVLVTGMASMAIVYAAVRIVAFNNPEFDERLDGVIYAVAAGLGVATVHNFVYVVRYGGVDLDVGSIRIVVNALGYAGVAGMLGYFIGQARFEKTSVFYLPAGVVLSAALLGLYFFLIEQTASTGLRAEFWRHLLLGLFLTLLIMGAVSWLVRRANEETARVAQLAATGDRWEPKPVEIASDRGE
ncbi:MAG: PrsW family glutamic-type intramembrane protease [Caldilinea sp.]|nr:PrsW family glutamic-type intramembrane protease [Caldilinea sp.]MDW8442511.1 PrsW family glutamic-type intramembrane protease [Caldilineaceae bacterium]